MGALPYRAEEHHEDIFSLLTQINYINNCLEHEESLFKIKDVLKRRNELDAIKNEISHRLDDLTEHAPTDLKEDVRQLKVHWNKVKTNLQDDKEISELLRGSTRELKQQMDRLYNKSFRGGASLVVADEGQPDRITSAVKPYFESLSEKAIALIEEKYPKTIRALFTLAVRLNEKRYGERLSHAFGQFSDSISSYRALFFLLLVDVCQSSSREPLEILMKLRQDHLASELFNQLRQLEIGQIERLVLNEADTEEMPVTELLHSLNIPTSDWQALLQIFNQFVANLANPSHLLVDLFLRMDQVEKGISCAKSLIHPIEQSKSLLDVILYLLSKNDSVTAITLVSLIKGESEKGKAVIKIIDQLLESKQTDQAMAFAQSFGHLSETYQALAEIAIQLTGQGLVDQALNLVNSILDPELKAYTLSRLVNILIAKGQFPKAIDVASAIEDPGFREDANGYIVRKLINLRQMNQAVKFVESIKNPKERTQAAKIVESAMAAYHQDERIKRLGFSVGL